MDFGKGFGKESKVYGESGEQELWSVLEESFIENNAHKDHE